MAERRTRRTLFECSTQPINQHVSPSILSPISALIWWNICQRLKRYIQFCVHFISEGRRKHRLNVNINQSKNVEGYQIGLTFKLVMVLLLIIILFVFVVQFYSVFIMVFWFLYFTFWAWNCSIKWVLCFFLII